MDCQSPRPRCAPSFLCISFGLEVRDVPGTPAATLALARKIAKSAGLLHVYTGNVHDVPGQSTYCHACGTCVIGREWFEITSWALDESGCCRSCGARCPGVFEQGPGLGGRGASLSSWAKASERWSTASDPVNGHLALDYHAGLSDEGILVIDGPRDFRRPFEISYLSLPIIPESRVLRLFSAVPGPDELLQQLDPPPDLVVGNAARGSESTSPRTREDCCTRVSASALKRRPYGLPSL